MDTWLIVLLVVIVLAVVALVALLALYRSKRSRIGNARKRELAREQLQEAQIRSARADKELSSTAPRRNLSERR